MRGDDELGALPHHVAHHRDQAKLTQRAEWRFRFIQQIQPIGHKARLEEVQEAFTVRVRVQPLATIASVDAADLFLDRALGQRLGLCAAVFVFVVHVAQVVLKFGAHLAHTPGVTKKILRAQK